MNTPTYTALDLLDTVIEFINLTPDSNKWSFEWQKNNTPRFVRLEKIQALMEAFVRGLTPSEDIGRSIKDFYSSDYNLFFNCQMELPYNHPTVR